MENLNKTNGSNKVVVFHTGRGGRFNNSGYVTCKGYDSAFDAEYYGINIYFGFENMNDDILEQLEEQNISVSDMASDWNDEAKSDFDSLNITDETGDAIKHDYLGDAVILDCSGNVLCAVEEYNSNEGALDIDGDYNTYSWKPVSELTEDEWEIATRDLSGWEVEEMIEDKLNDEYFVKFLRENDPKDYIYYIAEDKTLEDAVNDGEIGSFDTEEKAEEENYGGKIVEINDKFYCKI